MTGTQGGKHAIRGYLAQILISVQKTLREDNKWDEFEIESELEDKVDTKFITYEPSNILAVQVKQSINRINEKKTKDWAEELKKDIEAQMYELHIVSYTTENVIKMELHENVSIKLHQVNFEELLESATNRLNQYVIRLGYDRTNPKYINIILKSLITDFFFWAINKKNITREKFDDLLNSYISLYNPDLQTKETGIINDRFKEIKELIHLLKNYNAVQTNVMKEIEVTQSLGELFSELIKIGFRKDGERWLKNDIFEIFLGGNRFYIKNTLTNHNFYSEKAPDNLKNKSLSKGLIELTKYIESQILLYNLAEDQITSIKKDIITFYNLLYSNVKPDSIFRDLIEIFRNEKLFLVLDLEEKPHLDNTMHLYNDNWEFFVNREPERKILQITNYKTQCSYFFIPELEEKGKEVLNQFLNYIKYQCKIFNLLI